MVGLGLDVGQMFIAKQQLQAAADAAAQAGVMDMLNSTNSTGGQTYGSHYTCTTTDKWTPCKYASMNGTAADTVTIDFPAAAPASGAACGTGTSTVNICVTVQRTLHMTLMNIMGFNTATVSATAAASIAQSGSGNSIVVLNPSAAGAFSVSGGATVNLNGGTLTIDSSAAGAGNITNSSAHVTAKAINVKGTFSGSAWATPTPTTGAAAIPDPLATLAAPQTGTVQYNNPGTPYSPPNGTTLQPGEYIGGINVGKPNGSATVSFAPGTYYINGGGVSFANGTTSTGTGVTFYLTGSTTGKNATYAPLTVSGSANVTLSAPASGTYEGILFYQDQSVPNSSSYTATIGNGGAVTLSGTLYFKTNQVAFSGAAGISGFVGVVADEVSFGGSANLQYDSTGKKTGLFTKGVALVQ